MIERLKNKVIGVICGGYSSERDVSLRSGQNIYDALKRQGYTVRMIDPLIDNLFTISMDMAVIMLHGAFGEDGTTQAILEDRGIPFVGSGVNTSLMTINKVVTKQKLQQAMLPTPPFVVWTRNHLPEITQFKGPFFVKPISEGSSVGTRRVDRPGDLKKVGEELIEKYGTCMIEPLIEGKEITIGVIQIGKDVKAMPVLELQSSNEFYDYDAKYTPGKTELICPANLSEEMTQQCQDLAVKTHSLFKCAGVSRVDMIVNPKTGPTILEINTIPGMTNTSDVPCEAAVWGWSFDELAEALLYTALV